MERTRDVLPKPAASSADTSGDVGVTEKLSEPSPRLEKHEPLLLWVHPEARTTPLRPGMSRLGRSPSSDVVLNGSLISRHHAKLRRRGDSLEVHDQGSSNGVHVNGRKLGESPLLPGDVLRLVDHVAVLIWGDPSERRDVREVSPGVWGSRSLQEVFERIERVAPTRLSVLIQGESGTGKEEVARTLHERSGRSGDFVAVSCAAFAEGLLEAELFGHERGAFTGADRARIGYIQRAHQGTLFLDEVAELSPSAQTRLLRVIQEGEVSPVGGRDPVAVDVRWIAATHRDLTHEVKTAQFRLDLYHRLAGLTIRVPALRERPGDILPLFLHFVEEAGGSKPQLDEILVEALCSHTWPGNVRELRRAAESMLAVVGVGATWGREDLPKDIVPTLRERSAETGEAPSGDLDDREALLRALRTTRGNLSATAKQLNRSRQALYTALERHDLINELEKLRARRGVSGD